METKIIHIPNKALLKPGDLIVPVKQPGDTAREMQALSKKSQEPVKVATLSQEEIKEMFERQFGADQDHRTKQQWLNLIKQYGIDTVCEKENMTLEQITERVNEKLTKRMKRLAKLKARKN